MKAAALAQERRSTYGAIAAWFDVLALDPADRDAHAFLDGRLPATGHLSHAVPLFWRLVQKAPASVELRRAHARALTRLKRWAGALAAWGVVTGLCGFDDEATRETVLALGQIYAASGKEELLERVRQIADTDTRRRPSLWTQLALTFESAGEIDRAIAAWSNLIEFDGLNISAQQARDHLQQRKSGRISPTSPRILLVGNCQVLGIALCLRRLHPQADVRAELWAAHTSPEAAEAFLDSLAGFDIVIGQMIGAKSSENLRTDAIVARASKYIGIPRISFAGFHPDLIRLLNTSTPKKARFRAWHSAIIAGARRAGVPRVEVADYFNAYVFGRLGYFDEFAKAEALLRRECAEVEFDIDPVLATLRPQEAFMHIPDHPKIEFLDSMAREICRRAGLSVAPDAALPEDAQAARLVWPVHEPLAKRGGFAGSTHFIPFHPPTPMNLEQVVAHFYDLYSQSETPADPKVMRAAEVLRDIQSPPPRPRTTPSGHDNRVAGAGE